MTGPRRALRVLRALAVAGLVLGVQVTAGARSEPPPRQAGDALRARGAQLFRQGCVSCHGVDGGGTAQGPSLVGAGAASAHFYLTTGRMPLDEPTAQARRKRPAYTGPDIDALVAYVASLGGGPEIPRVDPARGDLVRGGELFRANCAACHGYAGRGGALQHGLTAPSLEHSDPVQVAEAVRIGPGTMPAFAEGSLSGTDLNSLTRYVEYVRDPPQRGGRALGNQGPIPEGFVAWFVGLAIMVAATLWIGTRE